jgi:hypothetical protein
MSYWISRFRVLVDSIKEAKNRIIEIIPRFPNAKCFGINNNGTPFHPLAMMSRNGRDPNTPKLYNYIK